MIPLANLASILKDLVLEDKLSQVEAVAIFAAVLGAPVNDKKFLRKYGTLSAGLITLWQRQHVKVVRA